MRRARTRAKRRAQAARAEAAGRRRRAFARALVAGLAVAVGLAGGWLGWRAAAPWAAGLAACATGPAPARALIVIDATDPLDPRWRAAAEAAILDRAATLPARGRLTIAALAPDPAAPVDVVFDACRPSEGGRGRFLFDAGLDAETRAARLSDFYDARVAPAAPAGRKRTPSPLLEALVALSDRTAGPESELILVSDMLQYSAADTHYGQPRDYEIFAASRAGAGLTAALSGVKVRVFYMRRPGLEGEQGPHHQAFWRAYFAAAGAARPVFEDDPNGAAKRLR